MVGPDPGLRDHAPQPWGPTASGPGPAAPFPADIAAEIYAHDPIQRAALANYKRQAQIQAAILGEGALLDPEAFNWVISEPGHADFGEIIDAALLKIEATGLAFTLKGVVLRRGEEVFGWSQRHGRMAP